MQSWRIRPQRGKSRTFAFARAHGTADFLLALDADMLVTVDPDWSPDLAVDAYTVELGGGGSTWRLPLVLRGDVEWVSHGRYHEWTGKAAGTPLVSLPTDAVRITMPAAAPLTPDKLRWQLSLIEADLADDPENGRWWFYVAQINRDLGNRDTAREAYRKRATMGGWVEEAYYAAYQGALLAQEWDAQASELMAAWQMHPTRLEALQALCRGLNQRGMHHAAYRLAVLPDEVPPQGGMFVDGWVWRWGMAWERSIAAWWVGHVDECRDLTTAILARADIPPDVRAAAERNLGLCEV